MLDNVVLTVFIGLAFVFLIYSLLCTIIQEMAATTLNIRGMILVKAIREMLDDRQPFRPTGDYGTRYLKRLWKNIVNKFRFLTCHLPDRSLAKAFYKHPSIKYLGSNGWRTKPSYIAPANFSATLVKILRGKDFDGSLSQMDVIHTKLFPLPHEDDRFVEQGNMTHFTPAVTVGQVNTVVSYIQPETLDHLRQLFIDAHKDVDKFKELLEAWFNETMDRATGWYKRLTRRMLFWTGLIIAGYANVDTLKIVHVLATDKSARDQMVRMATTYSQKAAGANTAEALEDRQKANEAFNSLRNDMQLSNVVLGIGHDAGPLIRQRDSLQKLESDSDPFIADRINKLNSTIALYDTDLWSLLGWLLTALAITLGAPFWFDLLNKLVSLRGTGPKPEEGGQSTNKTALNVGSVPAQQRVG